MRFKSIFIAILNVSFFTTTALLGFVSCNSTQTMDQKDKGKDISEIHNDSRFTDSAKSKDASFLEECALINFHEISLGHLGKDKSKTPEILVLSKMMTEDHTQASTQLKNLADKKNISLPVSAENSEDERINGLVKQNSKTFDRAFVDIVVDYQNEAISKFKMADSISDDAEIKAYISGILPNLKKNLEQAEKIQKSIK